MIFMSEINNYRLFMNLAVTPTIEELKVNNEHCKNKRGDSNCANYIKAGYECNGKYVAFFKKNCAKACEFC